MRSDTNTSIIYNGVKFDDWGTDYDNSKNVLNYWVGICSSCAKHYKFSSDILDNAGSGLCSVAGCNNKADYYADLGLSILLYYG